MIQRRRSQSYVTIMGSPFPLPVVVLTAATFILSVLGAVIPGLVRGAALFPVEVWRGQIWRLVTWPFFEQHPLGLIVACFMLAWLGRDLSRSWGARRFVLVYLFLALAAAGAVVALAPVSGAIQRAAYLGAWPLVGALVVAWGLLHATQRILLYFVVPVSGRNIVFLTVGITILYAVFVGFVAMLPHFAAQGAILVWLDRFQLFRRLWLRIRYAAYERELRRRSHLRVVRKEDRDTPSRWVH